MIAFNKEKCIKCQLCINDCGTGVISVGSDGYPQVSDIAGCLKCQHCFAVCPQGAVIFNGTKSEDVDEIGKIPSFDELANLIKSRRSVRRYSGREITPEVMQKLAALLNYTPTGCNDHRLGLVFVTGEKLQLLREGTNRILIKIIRSPFRLLMPKRYKRFFKRLEDKEDVIYRGAPALLLVTVHKDSPCKADDPTIALSWFELAAETLGLGCCWCGFAQRAFRMFPSLRKMLNVPSDHRIGGVILFGYPDIKYFRVIKPEPFNCSIQQSPHTV